MNLTKKYLILLMPLFLLQTIYLAGVSGRIELSKEYPLIEEGISTQRRIHPAESYFHSQKRREEPSRTANFAKLLVLLVDFQEADDPRTTGNGKYLLEQDPAYPLTIGAPPHDYEYFTAILESMKYYYLAASLGNYELEYEIFPREEDPKFAYTLPQTMGYYNPGMENYDLFIQRIEEYFRDIFTTADSYGEIDFGAYGHYLIIHAGSDWQHDIYGDTPGDLPSFFIQVGDGKEVWVNEGTVIIDHACNVPSTISQDGRYGVINAVIAHEFGHSLGFVDLYNVNNFYPAVGYWDIMDSGGAGRLVDLGSDGELYAIEGGLPALPSAWHRLLVWGDELKEMGVSKEINDFPLGSTISLAAASSLYDQENPLPYFIKVPLNATEYLLLENRHVDPDGDGGIAFKGAAPLTPGGTDYRVLLHPIGIYDVDLKPIYEYDWLLPGWMNRFGESFGGGIVAWHIDESVIFAEGYTYEDGTFASNYEINRINTNPNRRGVKLIEADNLYDIGNPYSWFWYGTEYEPYFRYKPILDQDGFFVNWSYEEFNRELSATSKPSLRTNSGNPSLYRIYEISSSAGVMTFKYSFEPFEHTGLLSNSSKINYLGAAAGTSFPDGVTEMPVFTDEGVYFFRHFYNQNYNLDEWSGFLNPFAYQPSKPLAIFEKPGMATKFFVPVDNMLIKISDNVGSFSQQVFEFDSEIVETPLLVETENDLIIVVPTQNELIITSEFGIEPDETIVLNLPDARVAYDGTNLAMISQNKLRFVNLIALVQGMDFFNPQEHQPYEIPTATGSDYYPLIYTDELSPQFSALFLQDATGDVYRFIRRQDFNKLENFFNLQQYTTASPTQLAMGNIQGKSYLFFAAGDYLFAIDVNGTLAQGYPRYIERKEFQPGGDIRVLEINNRLVLVLPVVEEGYLFYDFERGLVAEYSLIWERPDYPDHFYWEEATKRLYFFFADANDYLYENILTGAESDPILWNGYRNDSWSLFQGTHIQETDPDLAVKAYAFPNPASKGEVRIRVEGGEERIELQIYDISGKRLYKGLYDDNISSWYEIRWNTGNMATGVYFGIVKTNGKTANFKVAIE